MWHKDYATAVGDTAKAYFLKISRHDVRYSIYLPSLNLDQSNLDAGRPLWRPDLSTGGRRSGALWLDGRQESGAPKKKQHGI